MLGGLFGVCLMSVMAIAKQSDETMSEQED